MTVKFIKDFTYNNNSRTYKEGEVVECKNLYNGVLITKDKDYILKIATEVVYC